MHECRHRLRLPHESLKSLNGKYHPVDEEIEALPPPRILVTMGTYPRSSKIVLLWGKFLMQFIYGICSIMHI